MQSLPIIEIIDKFVDAVSRVNRIILSAPTGVGKSTQIPQILLDRCSVNGRILVLQPRRIAARMLCARVARERFIKMGDEVGYQTRLDTCSSQQTRILYITAGILPRYFLSNRQLSGIDAIVLDEFHERSIHNDLALGLVKNVQDTVRHDLKLIVMSATLDITALRKFLSNSIYIKCKSTNYSVEMMYSTSMPTDGKTKHLGGRPLPPRSRRATGGSSASPKQAKPVWDQAAEALRTLVRTEEEGDVLIFMPGVYEIHRTISSCKQLKFNEPMRFLPLYGDLPTENQEEIMLRGSGRKVIVATNIAETSLTIPGVRYVIDSGLVRQNRYDPHRGLNTLFIEPISKDSADQRAGRAGREAPGICFRLCSLQAHKRRNERTDPEIKRIDLAEVILHLKSQGFNDIGQFPWLDPPTQILVDNAFSLLVELGALKGYNSPLTGLGEKMARIPAHPRVARLLIEAAIRDCRSIGSLIAAVVSERSIILKDKDSKNLFASRFTGSLDTNLLNRLQVGAPSESNTHSRVEGDRYPQKYPGSKFVLGDLFSILNALAFAREYSFKRGSCQAAGIHGAASRQIWRTSNYLSKLTPNQHLIKSCREINAEEVIKCLLVAYSDRLAKRRDSGSLIYMLSDGRRAELAPNSAVKACDLIIAIELVDLGSTKTKVPARISLACEARRSWLNELLPMNFRVTDTHSWNDTKLTVERYKTTYFNNFVIEEIKNSTVDKDVAAQTLAAEIKKKKLPLDGWNKEVKSWIQRVQCVVQWFPEKRLKDYNDDQVERILFSLCKGSRRYADVKKKSCIGHVKNQLTSLEQKFVEAMAPEKVALPNGRRMRIKYSAGKPPRGNAKIQDLFGLMETPSVAKDRQKVLIEILAPNFRPIQVTDNLKGFWQDLYPKVKKELSRRYPSHEWR